MAGNVVTDHMPRVQDYEIFRFSRILSRLLRVFFRDAVKVTIRNPVQAFFFPETEGGCALRVHREWVKRLLHAES